MRKVNLKLKPYTCLTIVSFLREFVDKDDKDPQLRALIECVEEFEKEVMDKMDLDQLEDASVENSINQLTVKAQKEKDLTPK